jgi:hypothetical protein
MKQIKKNLLAAAAVLIGLAVGLTTAFASESDPTRPIALNQTDGFGNEKLLVFTYFQNFSCIHEPFADLDGPNHTGDGHVAADDPDEFQAPKCILGETGSGSIPSIDPTGRPIESTEPLFVIVPFFDADGDGTVDALDATPGVDVQCPEPASPLTVRPSPAPFGTCTMHPTTLHAEPVGLGDLPLVNHSHIIDGDSFGPIWWQIIGVLIFDRNVWPDIDGGCPAGRRACLTSVKALRNAQAAGNASQDVPTNFFLFFDAKPLKLSAEN